MRHVPDSMFPLSNTLYRVPTGFHNTYWRLYEFEAYACLKALNYLQQRANGEFIPMAKRKQNTNNFGVEFINIEMDDKHEKAFTAYHGLHIDKMGKLVSELAADGNKIGISFDGDNECFIISVTCKDESSDNHNKCYTSRSDDWVEALMIALYKWDEIFGRTTWVGKTQRKNWG